MGREPRTMKTTRSLVPPGPAAPDKPPLAERAPVTERISTGPSRGTGPLIALLVGFVAIAILKPWDGSATPATGSGAAALGHGLTTARLPAVVQGVTTASRPAVAEAPARPSPSPSVPRDPNATPCMSANGERLVTLLR